MSIFRICLLLLMAITWMRPELSYSAADDIPYRLLKSDKRSFSTLIVVNYAISIDRYLNRAQIGQVLCQVLRDQSPSNYSLLTIAIYYKLDKMFVHNYDNGEFSEHIIATYTWNSRLPNNQDRLGIWRDSVGNILKPVKSYDFDHSKACQQVCKGDSHLCPPHVSIQTLKQIHTVTHPAKPELKPAEEQEKK